jgi:large subunit ribosomal protein L4
MKLDILKTNGKKAGTKIEAQDSVFAVTPNEHVVYLSVKAELAALRAGTHKTKTRAEVSGGGKKPYKQKGRGGARAGSTRSPIWVGGGHAFALEPRDYSIKLPRKVRQLARRSVLSDKINQNAIIVLDELKVGAPKTKEFLSLLGNLGLTGKKLLILTSYFNEDLYLAGRNIKNIAIIEASSASAYDLIDNEVILTDVASIEILNNMLSN